MTKSTYLFPARFKKFGWMLFFPCILLGFVEMYHGLSPRVLDFHVFAISFGALAPDNYETFDFIKNNIFNELLSLGLICSGLIIAFSKEKDEDELISALRLKCLVWAIYWNYGLLSVAFVLFYNFTFFYFMVFNMFTPLVLFIIRFNWLVMRLRKSLKDEE